MMSRVITDIWPVAAIKNILTVALVIMVFDRWGQIAEMSGSCFWREIIIGFAFLLLAFFLSWEEHCFGGLSRDIASVTFSLAVGLILGNFIATYFLVFFIVYAVIVAIIYFFNSIKNEEIIAGIVYFGTGASITYTFQTTLTQGSLAIIMFIVATIVGAILGDVLKNA